MAIETQYVVHARVDGSRKILSTQMGGAGLLPTDTPDSWVPASMQLNGGGIFGVDLTTIFDVSGSGGSGRLTLDLVNLGALEGANPTAYNTIVDAFIDGGILSFDITLSDTENEPVTVHLRALKTTDFELQGNQLRALLPDGVTGDNLQLPDGDSLDNYQFAVSDDFADPSYTLSSTAVGSGGNTLSVDAPEPLPTSGPAQIRITRTYGALEKSSILPATLLVPAVDPPDEMGGAPNDDPDPLGGQGGQTEPGTGGDPTSGDGDGDSNTGDGDGDSAGDGDSTGDGDGDGDGMPTGAGGMVTDPDGNPMVGSDSMSDGTNSGAASDDSGCGCHMERSTTPGSALWITPAVLLWLRMRRPIPRRLVWWRKI